MRQLAVCACVEAEKNLLFFFRMGVRAGAKVPRKGGFRRFSAPGRAQKPLKRCFSLVVSEIGLNSITKPQKGYERIPLYIL